MINGESISSTINASYTWLDARQRSSTASLDGNQLPHRARHQIYGRATREARVRGHRLRGWLDGSYASGNVVDQANIIALPARHFLGAGGSIAAGRFDLAIEVKNLTDNTVELLELDPPPRPDLTEVPHPVSDFFGYPLPGRAFYATLRARLSLRCRR